MLREREILGTLTKLLIKIRGGLRLTSEEEHHRSGLVRQTELLRVRQTRGGAGLGSTSTGKGVSCEVKTCVRVGGLRRVCAGERLS